MRSRNIAFMAMLAMTLSETTWAAGREERVFQIEIPAQSLGSALTRLAATTGHQLVVDGALTRGRTSRRISGRYTIEQALATILRGSGLGFAVRGDTLIIRRERPAPIRRPLRPPVDTPRNIAPPHLDLVVTGTRGTPRTVLDSAVPVDVVSADDIATVASTSTPDILKALIPSYAVARNPNSDGSTFVRPATLRGLPGDETLILVDSRRIHRSPVVTTSDYGSQSPDVSTFPALAIATVEVLRDGAAAQYGTDAIAGVINFRLRNDDHGTHLQAQQGQYNAGDGQSTQIAANIGRRLIGNGFVNATLEYARDGRTTRARQFCNVTFCAVDYAASHPDYAALIDLSKPIQRWGQPKSRAVRAVVNAQTNLSDGKIFALATLSRSRTTGDFHYRYPGNGQPVEDNPVRLADGTIFRFNQLYPAGFVPQFSGRITDYNLTAGYEWANPEGWGFDVSASYGRGAIAYRLTHSVNASLGPASPTRFKPGKLASEELSFNANISGSVDAALFPSRVEIAAGIEYRREGYRIFSGDPASYTAGPYAAGDPYGLCRNDRASTQAIEGLDCDNPDDPVYSTLPTGANGFPGFAPARSGKYARNSKAAFLEASTDLSRGWSAVLAARAEQFSDFGTTAIGKFATRFEFAPGFAVRGSVGSGFRAPSIGQLAYSSVAVVSVDGNVTQTGLLPASDPVARYLGARPLQPEKSFNVSAGITARPTSSLSLSADFYRIAIEGRIYSSSLISVTPDILDQLRAAGIATPEQISSLRFFQNAFDSTTQGFDIVTTYQARWRDGQRSTISASLNLNRLDVGNVHPKGLLSSAMLFNARKQQPRYRAVVQLNHKIGSATAMLRANVFGPYSVQRDSAAARYPIQRFHAEAMIDAEIKLPVGPIASLTIGARNILNNYPQADTIGAAFNGAIYRPDSIVDWQGAFFYARAGVEF